MKLLFKTLLLTFSLSLFFTTANAASFNPATVINKAVEQVFKQDIKQQAARGFRSPKRGYGMNFGGNNQKGNNNYQKQQQPNNNNAQPQNHNNAAANTANAQNKTSGLAKGGLLGFLGGLGMAGLLMAGVGVLGGGFLIYLLIAFLVPVVLAYMRRRTQEQSMASNNMNHDFFTRKDDDNNHSQRF